MICELEVVVAEDLGLDAQALLQRSREQTPTGSHSCISRRTHSASSGSSRNLARQLVDREVGRLLAVLALDALEIEEAVVVEVADDELGEALLRRR